MKKIISIFIILLIITSCGCENNKKIRIGDVEYYVIMNSGKLQCSTIDENMCNMIFVMLSREFSSGVGYDNVTINELNDIVPIKELKMFESNNTEYYYNIYTYDDYNIVLNYKKDNNNLILDSTLLCGDMINYDEILKDENCVRNNDTDLWSIGRSPVTNIKILSASFLNKEYVDIPYTSMHITDKDFI